MHCVACFRNTVRDRGVNMRLLEKWEYDEFKQIGVDFQDAREVQAYDERIAKFRNTDEQNQLINPKAARDLIARIRQQSSLVSKSLNKIS